MERFFISGCQRSGTTLLRLVLEAHPDIQCFDEAVGYKILINELGNAEVSYSEKEGSVLLGFKIPRFAEQLAQSVFNDPDYGKFCSFYRGEKVIHVFRDAVDVIASMLNLRDVGDVSWIDRYGVVILQSMISGKNIDSVLRKKYDEIERRGFPVHLVGALYWEIKNQGFFDLLHQGRDVCPVRYESLVFSPRVELLKVCDYLGVEWSEFLLNHPRFPHGELDEDGLAIGKTDPRRGIDTASVGKNLYLLNEIQIDEVRGFVEDMARQIDAVLLR